LNLKQVEQTIGMGEVARIYQSSKACSRIGNKLKFPKFEVSNEQKTTDMLLENCKVSM